MGILSSLALGNYLVTKEISDFTGESFFEKELKSLKYNELLRLGFLACEFPPKVVKEILEEKKGNIEEAANEIIRAMRDEYWDEKAASERLSSIFWEIYSERRKTILIFTFFK